jgi:hypothetical protein
MFEQGSTAGDPPFPSSQVAEGLLGDVSGDEHQRRNGDGLAIE